MLHQVRDCEGLAGARHAQQHLALEILIQTLSEQLDGFGLVACGTEVGFDAEFSQWGGPPESDQMIWSRDGL